MRVSVLRKVSALRVGAADVVRVQYYCGCASVLSHDGSVRGSWCRRHGDLPLQSDVALREPGKAEL